jgi:hypothetical protein
MLSNANLHNSIIEAELRLTYTAHKSNSLTHHNSFPTSLSSSSIHPPPSYYY